MINSIGPSVTQTGTSRSDTGGDKAPRPQAVPEPTTTSAQSQVDQVHSQVTYDAGLDALRSANKMMMGYLLNIKI